MEAAVSHRVLNHPASTAAQALRQAAPGQRRRRGVSPSDQPVLQVSSLTKTFGDTVALDAIDLTVNRGETVAVVGPSGSGKSTLARLVAGLAVADEGCIQVHGGRVQLVAQNPFSALEPRWTVARIVEESLLPTGIARAERKRRALAALDAVGLGAEFARHRPHELSGGQSQRVAIARALAPRPSIIVLDEAVSALDVVSQATVLDVLAELQMSYGMAYVFITHDTLVARDIAHRIIEVRAGRVSELGSDRRYPTRPSGAGT